MGWSWIQDDLGITLNGFYVCYDVADEKNITICDTGMILDDKQINRSAKAVLGCFQIT